MKTLKLFFSFIILSTVFSSCADNFCNEEVCQCTSLGIELDYNFDTTKTNHFPIDEMENFKVIYIDNQTKDTTRTYFLKPKYWDLGRVFQIVLSGELSKDEQNKNTKYYIVNEKLNYKDSITNINYEYTSVVDCNEYLNSNYCGTADCMLFDESSVSFEFNGKKYSYSDSPITINYEKK